MNDSRCTAFLQWALPQLGLRWAGFRKVRRQVCKRLARRIQSLELGGLDDYRARLASDQREWAALDSMCRITISRFYRDKGVFRALTDTVLPRLAIRAAEQGQQINCWSAGCASGEEVYTLKIIWDALVSEHYPNVQMSFIGTDVDEVLLERARRGCFRSGTLKEMPEHLVEQSFETSDDVLCVKERHRPGIAFAIQDIRTTMPAGPFDLVLCRNLVLTYFADALQRRVLEEIARRLRPEAWLVIGAHECLPVGVIGFDPLPECRQVFRYIPEVQRLDDDHRGNNCVAG